MKKLTVALLIFSLICNTAVYPWTWSQPSTWFEPVKEWYSNSSTFVKTTLGISTGFVGFFGLRHLYNKFKSQPNKTATPKNSVNIRLSDPNAPYIVRSTNPRNQIPQPLNASTRAVTQPQVIEEHQQHPVDNTVSITQPINTPVNQILNDSSADTSGSSPQMLHVPGASMDSAPHQVPIAQPQVVSSSQPVTFHEDPTHSSHSDSTEEQRGVEEFTGSQNLNVSQPNLDSSWTVVPRENSEAYDDKLLNKELLTPLIIEMVNNQHTTLQRKEIVDHIVKGGAFRYAISNNDDKMILGLKQKEYLESIIALTWYAYSEGLKSSKALKLYEEGSFSIEDKGQKLFKYIQKYWQEMVKQYGPTNPFAYARKSTHVGTDCIGIDMRLNGTEYPQPWLPLKHKTHLLCATHFIPGKHHILFLKPENHGLHDYKDYGLHALGAIASVGRKLGFGSNDKEEYAKEHIPTEIDKQFETILNSSNLSSTQIKAMRAHKKANRLAGIYESLKTITSENPPPTQAKELQNHLEATYSNLDIRMGNEMIVAGDQMRQSSEHYYNIHKKVLNQ